MRLASGQCRTSVVVPYRVVGQWRHLLFVLLVRSVVAKLVAAVCLVAVVVGAVIVLCRSVLVGVLCLLCLRLLREESRVVAEKVICYLGSIGLCRCCRGGSLCRCCRSAVLVVV